MCIKSFKNVLLLIPLLISLMSSIAFAGEHENDTFKFAVVGDTDYGIINGVPFSVGSLKHLVKTQINQAGDIDFVVHVGDIKGIQSCTNDYFKSVRSIFESSTHPWLYTPGDNEWTDCAGQPPFDSLALDLPLRDPIDALASIRGLFFKNQRSFGQGNISVERQSDFSDKNAKGFDPSTYIENQRWEHGNVMFITVNIPGSLDDCTIRTIPNPTIPFTSPNTFPYQFAYADVNTGVGQVLIGVFTAPTGNPPASCSTEKKKREAANLAWLRDSFQQAKKDKLLGVVVLIQAEMYFTLEDPTLFFPFSYSNGDSVPAGFEFHGFNTDQELYNEAQVFVNYRKTLHDEAAKFKKPVLIMHGDDHVFDIQPQIDVNLPYYMQAETFGAPDTGWLKVTVNPRDSKLFTIECGGIDLGSCADHAPLIIPPQPDKP